MIEVKDSDYPPVSLKTDGCFEIQEVGKAVAAVFTKVDGMIGMSYDNVLGMVSLFIREELFAELVSETNAEVTRTEYPNIQSINKSITIDGVEYHCLQDATVVLVAK
jgi:hypothetical protein